MNHDTADRALVEDLRRSARVRGYWPEGMAADALARRIAEGQRLREAIRQIEWSNAGKVEPAHWCPWCGEGRQQGHAQDCVVAALVAEEPPR